MALGPEVGKISIRVVPDLTQFRIELAAELAAWEKKVLHIKVELVGVEKVRTDLEAAAKDLTADVDVTANTKGLREKVKAAASGVKAKVEVEEDAESLDRFKRRMLARLKSAFSQIEVGLDLTADGEYLRRMFDATEKQIQKSINLKVPVDLEEAGVLRAEVDRLVKKAEERAGAIKLKVVPDFALYQKGKRILEATDKFRLKVEFDEKADFDLKKRLAALAEKNRIKLVPDIDYPALERERFKMVTQLEKDRIQLKIDVRNFADAEADAKAAGTRMGNVFQKAFKSASEKDQGRFFKNFFKVPDMPDLNKDNKQVTFLDRLGDRLKTLPGKMLNSIKNFRLFGLGLGTMLAIASLLPAAISLVSGVLLTLPAVIAGVLIPIAAIALGFEGIKKAAEVLKPGMESLKAVMSTAFEKGLAKPFQDLTKIFPVLNEWMPMVASGLSDIAQSMVDAVTSVPGLGKLKSIIGNIGAGLTSAAPGIGKFTTGFVDLIEAVSRKFPGVGASLTRIGDQFSGWIDKITMPNEKGVSQLDTALRSLKDALAPLGGAVGDLFRKGFEKLLDPEFSRSMKTFMEDMRALANVSFDGLAGAFNIVAQNIRLIKDGWNELPQGLRDWLGGGKDETPKDPNALPTRRLGMVPLQDKPQPEPEPKKFGFTEFISQFGLLRVLVPGLMDSFNTYKVFVLAGVDALKAKFSEWYNSLAPMAATAVANMVIAFANLPSLIGTAVSTLSTIVSTAFGAMVTAVVMKGTEVAAEVASWPGRFVSALGSLAGTLVGAGVELVVGLLTSIQQKVAEVEGEISSWPGRFVAAAGNMGGALIGAGVALMNGLKSGIEDGLRSVLAFAGSIAAKIAAVKGPLPKDRTTLVPAGQALMQGLDDGLRGGLESVLNTARGLADQIAEAVNQGFDPAQFQDSIKSTLEALEIERSKLKVDYNGIPKEDKAGRESVRNRMQEITNLKDTLGLTKKQNTQQENANKKVDEANKKWVDLGKNITDSATGVGMSVAKSYAQDLGISGGGALGAATDWGMQFGSQFVFNVSNMDEAIQGQRAQTAVQSLQYTQR